MDPERKNSEPRFIGEIGKREQLGPDEQAELLMTRRMSSRRQRLAHETRACFFCETLHRGGKRRSCKGCGAHLPHTAQEDSERRSKEAIAG